MKKIAAIFLLSLYLFSATDLKELLKINVVIQHYEETVKHDGASSFWHFLLIHYVTDDNNDSDNDRDSQLPFKSPGIFMGNSTFISVPYQLVAANIKLTPIESTYFLVYNEIPVITSFHAKVWHPPQFLV